MKQAATFFFPLLIILPGITLTSEDPQVALQSKPVLTLSAKIHKEAQKPLSTEGQSHLTSQNLYQLLAAELALDRENPEFALENYIAAAKETQDPAIASRATQIALAIAPLEVAIEPALIWAKNDKKNLEAQITLAAVYIRLNQTDKAVPFLQAAERTNPNEAFQYFLILYKQLKDEESQRVIEALRQLVKKETSVVSGHLALAEIYVFLEKMQDAQNLCQQALKIDPTSSNAIQLYAEIVLRTQGKAAAKAFLDTTLAQSKQSGQIQVYYSQFLFENGFQDEAKKEVEKLAEDASLPTEESLLLTRLSMQAQWFEIAQKLLKRTSADPDNKDLSYYFLARIAEMQNQDDVAIEWFKQVLTGQFHVVSQIRAASMLQDKKRFSEALEVLSHTQPSDSAEKKQIILAIVDVLKKSDHYEKALLILNENIEFTPDEIDYLYARSLVNDHLNHPDNTEADLKAILALQPDHVDALNAIGYLLVNKTTRYEEASKYLTEALKLSPNNASVLDSMGWLYYKKGDYKKSLEYLQKALNIMPDGEIAAHLGEVMWHMKDFEGAKRVWHKALEQHPTHENVKSAMRRLMRAQ